MKKNTSEKWSDELGLIRATIVGTLIGFAYKPDPKLITGLSERVIKQIKKDIEKIVRKEIKSHAKRNVGNI